jgi:hypothetical protein
MRSDIVIEFAGDKLNGKVPAGRLECAILTDEKTIEATGHRIGSSSIAGQAAALKSLAFRLTELANGLGYTADLKYIEEMVADSERGIRDAYAAAVEWA